MSSCDENKVRICDITDPWDGSIQCYYCMEEAEMVSHWYTVGEGSPKMTLNYRGIVCGSKFTVIFPATGEVTVEYTDACPKEIK